MSKQKVVMITGVSSGIGKEIAKQLSNNGAIVFGTSRDPSRSEKIKGVELLRLDVRSDESVKSFVEKVFKQTGRLDVLINNAGYSMIGAMESSTMEEAKAQFETNFFGVIRMVNAVLPIMRQQKSGQIINMSSIVGLFPIPFLGLYSATKFAVEGYSEALYHEIKPFNINVSLVEPGFVRTSFADNSVYPANVIEDYAPWLQRFTNKITTAFEKATEPVKITQKVQSIVESKKPKLRYHVGKDASFVVPLHRFFPARIFEKIWRTNFNLDIKQRDLTLEPIVSK